LLSDVEIAAGEKLRADFFFAQLTPHVTANWSMLLSETGGRRSSPDHGAELADHVVAARERVSRALQAAGPDHAGLLIDVCCFLKGLEAAEKSRRWPQRAAKIVLGIALRNLAIHYGYVNDPVKAAPKPGRISHWGVADYRPRGDVERE
jgi:hypothetical protein